jgi:hypothetical protein
MEAELVALLLWHSLSAYGMYDVLIGHLVFPLVHGNQLTAPPLYPDDMPVIYFYMVCS